MDNVYLLKDENNEIWGVYSNKAILYNVFYNLKKMNKFALFSINVFTINSNIITQTFLEEDFNTFFGIEKKHVQDNRDINRELEKAKEKLNIFRDNFVTFNRLLKDRVITLDETNLSNIPELFRDKFEIYRDIILKKIPDEDQFGYFSDRYAPQKRSLTIETINDINLLDNESEYTTETESEEETDEDDEEDNEEDNEEADDEKEDEKEDKN